MKIKKITLKNKYKRFHHLTIDLTDEPKRIVALVGENGCGKSSVFDGMLYLQSHYHRIGNTGSRGYEYHSMEKNQSFSPAKNIEIEFESEKFFDCHQRLRDEGNGKEKTIFSFRSPYRYNSSLKVNEVKAIPNITNNQYGASSTADVDSKMDENYRRLHIAYTNYLKENDCKPSEAENKVIGDLNESLSHCLSLEISSLGDIQASKGTVWFKKTDSENEFEFNVLSSGEKEIVDILIDLYLRKDDYTESIYIIDEPELHINTTIQKNFLIEINKMVPSSCQIWIATHSIGLLRALKEELSDECQIIYFEPGIQWASTEQTLTPMEKTRANWQKIFSVALDDLSYLVSPKRIVYCEGKDSPGKNGEEEGLDAIVYNNIFNEKYPDTLFISSGGNTELDQRSDIAIKILRDKVFKDIEILVLKDRDMNSSQPSTTKDRKIYLKNNPKHHRVLERFEIENYLYDEEVLKVYCNENNYTFNQEEYKKHIKDIQNDNLKDITSKIKKICGIQMSINQETFKKNLSKCIDSNMSVYKEIETCIFNLK